MEQTRLRKIKIQTFTNIIMTKQTNTQQMKEIKDAIQGLNEQMVALDAKIMSNHQEVMNKIELVEKKTNEALNIATKNQTDILKLKEDNKKLKEEITNQQNEINAKTADHIMKVEAQLKATLIELDDLRNRSMRSTLVFKNIREEPNETWEDTCQIMSSFIATKLDLSYTKEFIDSMISRAHRGAEKDQESNGRQHQQREGSKPIFVKFVNWRVAEEIKSRVIQLNAQKRTKVVVNQMYSKEITTRRNNALRRRREILEEDGSIQIKLDYPAVLKFKKKGTRNGWDTLETF